MSDGNDFVRRLLDLEARGATGVLRVLSGSACTFLYVHDGRPVFAEGGHHADDFGAVLHEEGWLTQGQVLLILSQIREGFERGFSLQFGATAIELGFLSPHAVHEGLRAQVQRKILDCFRIEEPELTFERAEALPEGITRLDISLAPLVVAGVREIYDDHRVGSFLAPHIDRFVVLRDSVESVLARLELRGGDDRLLRTLDGTRTVAQLMVADPELPGLLAALFALAEVSVSDERLLHSRPREPALSSMPSVPFKASEAPSPAPKSASPPAREPTPAVQAAPTPTPQVELPLTARVPSAGDAQAAPTPTPQVELPLTARVPSAGDAEPAPPEPPQTGATPNRADTLDERRRRARWIAARLGGALPVTRPPPASSPSPVPPDDSAGEPAAPHARSARVPAPRPAAPVPSAAVDPQVALMRARRHLVDGAFAAALRELELARAADPDLPNLDLLIAWARFRDVSVSQRQGQHEQLMALALEKLKRDRDDAFAHYVLGHLRLAAGDEDKALRHFTLAVRNDATNLDAQRYVRLLSARLDRARR